MKLTIVGLGPGAPSLLTLEARSILDGAAEVTLRTAHHPVASTLAGKHVNVLDDLLDPALTPEDRRAALVAEVLRLARRPEGVIYAVPGNPTVDDPTVPPLLEQARAEGIETQVVAGISAAAAAPGETAAGPASDAGEHFTRLVAIVARLRDPEGGCPWDRQQTHESLKAGFLQEAYEVLAALDEGEPEMLREELGDILLHVVMQAQIAAEQGEFTVSDLLVQLSSKLIRRHPHVFGGESVKDAAEVVANWEAIKRAERGDRQPLLSSVAANLPALAYAQELLRRAARAGFEWPAPDDALRKVREEIAEFQAAATPEEQRHEFGDLLLALVNLARLRDIDAEEALRLASRRFYRRFGAIEEEARRQNRAISDFAKPQLLAMWEAAKAAEA